MEPNESGKGYEFVNAIVGGAVPKEYIPAVDAGIQGAMNAGVVAGFPVVDVKVTLYDGSYHEVDSSEMAFKIAGSMAFKEACRKADPTLLEPIMKVSVIVPDEYMGDVIGDLNSRRGQIDQPRACGQLQHGFVPHHGAQQLVQPLVSRCVLAHEAVVPPGVFIPEILTVSHDFALTTRC